MHRCGFGVSRIGRKFQSDCRVDTQLGLFSSSEARTAVNHQRPRRNGLTEFMRSKKCRKVDEKTVLVGEDNWFYPDGIVKSYAIEGLNPASAGFTQTKAKKKCNEPSESTMTERDIRIRREVEQLPKQIQTLYEKNRFDTFPPEQKQQAIRDYYAFVRTEMHWLDSQWKASRHSAAARAVIT